MPHLKIRRVKVNAKKLRSLPEKDRHFITIIGHSLNELNIIYRCIFASSNEWHGSFGPERDIIWSQNLFFLRLHFSKCHEIWEVYKDYRQCLRAHEKNILQHDGIRHSKKSLDNYFSGKNMATLIRKGYGFHYPVKQIPHFPLRQFDDDDEFDIFLHETRMNSYFSMCDFLVHRSMEKTIFGDIDDDKLQEHMGEIFNNNTMLNGHILNFFSALLGHVMTERLGIDVNKAETVTISDVTRKDQLKLGFFLDPAIDED